MIILLAECVIDSKIKCIKLCRIDEVDNFFSLIEAAESIAFEHEVGCSGFIDFIMLWV